MYNGRRSPRKQAILLVLCVYTPHYGVPTYLVQNAASYPHRIFPIRSSFNSKVLSPCEKSMSSEKVNFLHNSVNMLYLRLRSECNQTCNLTARKLGCCNAFQRSIKQKFYYYLKRSWCLDRYLSLFYTHF